MSRLLQVVAVIVTLVYPLGVYFGLQYFEPRALVLFIIMIFGIRTLTLAKSPMNHWLWLPLLTILGVWIWISNTEIGLKFYPVLVNLSLFVLFGLSILHPPSIVEKFARLRGTEISPKIVSYTRKVTLVWCGFFLVNASIALITCLWATIHIWAIYNGLVSYCMIGAIFFIEYLVRRRVKRRISG